MSYAEMAKRNPVFIRWFCEQDENLSLEEKSRLDEAGATPFFIRGKSWLRIALISLDQKKMDFPLEEEVRLLSMIIALTGRGWELAPPPDFFTNNPTAVLDSSLAPLIMASLALGDFSKENGIAILNEQRRLLSEKENALKLEKDKRTLPIYRAVQDWQKEMAFFSDAIERNEYPHVPEK